MGRLLLGGKNSIKLGASKCRNGRLAHPTIDAFVGMNHQHVFALVETIDGADLHAVHQFALDATLVDNVGQLDPLQQIAGVNSVTMCAIARLVHWLKMDTQET